MAIDMLTGREAIPEDQKQIPGVHPHMRPSRRNQPFQQYPRWVFKGPADATRQSKLVNSVEEEKAAVSIGWRLHRTLPPQPETPKEPTSDEGEPEVIRRGPGRPRKAD